MFKTVIVLSLIGAVMSFTSRKSARTSQALYARSKSVPFLDQPAALTGKMPGDVGFDPLGFTGQWLDKDWSQQIVPDIWPDAAARKPITTVEWMREAELKHGRICMLAVLGWVAVDSGLRLPGQMFESIPNSLAAHDAAVKNGSMGYETTFYHYEKTSNSFAL